MKRVMRDGSPEPLGLTLDAKGANVAVYSAHATGIELCLFDQHGQTEVERLRLPGRTGEVFHGHFEDIVAGQRYGLRAYGPYAPSEGHLFNPSKLLADPYARLLDRPFKFAKAQYHYQWKEPGGDVKPDSTDSADFMPKAIAIDPSPARPRTGAIKPWTDTIIYELHVRGFTKMHPKVPEAIRGTLAGLAHPAAVEHLARLGVTCVELLPLAAGIDEYHLYKAGLTNYWGYNPVTLMAPDPRLAPGGWNEIAASVAAIKAAGIEVIVDVVLNHTGESGGLGPSLSLRGLDNATYYRLLPNDKQCYINDSGCGNTLALDRPPMVRLAMDALRTWVTLGGVDGFRFDLATALGRRDNGFEAAAPLLTAISQDPILREVRLIAEPWDIGPGGYQLGAFPSAWGEWNDKFRDTMRRFWRGDGWLIGEAATRFTGSSDVFSPRRPPSRSVNFIVAHDGFTLADLVSYERKHNEANGEDNRDGTDNNCSWNNGEEGTTDHTAVLAARRRDQRNLLATLLLARGTPMLGMGAECGHSQAGNNNAYAQDNAISWLDWDTADKTLAAFTARLIQFRAAHPALKRDCYLTGSASDETLIPDAEWYNPDGTPMQPRDWSNGDRRTVIAAFYAAEGPEHSADRAAVILHAGVDALSVALPESRPGYCWRHCLDTSQETGEAGGGIFPAGAIITLAPRSVAVLEECREDAAGSQDIPRQARTGVLSHLLDRLARAAGLAPVWFDITGVEHIVADSTKQALLADMGFPANSNAEVRENFVRLADLDNRRKLPATVTANEGDPVMVRLPIDGGPPGALVIEREDGSQETVRLSPGNTEFSAITALDGRRLDTVLAKLPPQPAGHHRILSEHASGMSSALTVAPKRCFLPPAVSSDRRKFGIAAQLYSLRRDGDQGIGDFTALGELAGLAAESGAATVGLNPLHALFPANRDCVSPYYPSDRRFIDPIYIDVTALEGIRARAALEERKGSIAALSALDQVDYPGVWALKRAILEAGFADFNGLCVMFPDAASSRDFEAFTSRGGESLQRFACFQAISETRNGEAWRHWPAGLAGCDPGALASFSQEHAALVRFHLYLQWLADRQFSQAAATARNGKAWLGFYRDLAVGASPDGAEVWGNPDQFLAAASVGAPPDPFAEGGQNWGLRAPNPVAWRASGYRIFNEVIGANMVNAGVLRIDHAMGLTRLFVIPAGAKALEGAYLAFPEKDLIAQLALQSVRARCVVAGEDLGTVPDNFRATMDAASILSYRVLWFERDAYRFNPASAYPAKSVACVSTHDLPTIAGWWLGEDIREKEALGLISPEAAKAARQERIASKQELLRAIGLPVDMAAGAMTRLDPSIIAAAHKFIGATPSLIAIAQIDDLAGETVSVNLPGTDRERPNWQRKLGGTVASLSSSLAALRMH